MSKWSSKSSFVGDGNKSVSIGGGKSLCTNEDVNTEPGILAAYSPQAGQSVGRGGKIKVWINDERPPFIAPGEKLNAKTGAVVKAGNRSAKAPDGYLWEPALYLSPKFVESGGTPHFPSAMLGDLNNNPPTKARKAVSIGKVETPPAGARMDHEFSSEYIWDVDSLKLAPGKYTGEFVIFDGDRDRGIGCLNITIAGGTAKPVPAPVKTTTTTTTTTTPPKPNNT